MKDEDKVASVALVGEAQLESELAESGDQVAIELDQVSE
jgi:hypothetical protein